MAAATLSNYPQLTFDFVLYNRTRYNPRLYILPRRKTCASTSRRLQCFALALSPSLCCYSSVYECERAALLCSSDGDDFSPVWEIKWFILASTSMLPQLFGMRVSLRSVSHARLLLLESVINLLVSLVFALFVYGLPLFESCFGNNVCYRLNRSRPVSICPSCRFRLLLRVIRS